MSKEFRGKVFMNGYLIIQRSPEKGKMVSFFDFPRKPEIGNDDFYVAYNDGILNIHGSDGYGAVSSAEYVLKEEGILTPVLGGFEFEEDSQITFQDIIEFIAWALGNEDDLAGQYMCIKSTFNESWDFFSWDEKFKFMMELVQ